MNNYQKAKQRLEKVREELAAAKALTERAHQELKKEFKCDTIDEAKKLLSRLTKKKERVSIHLDKLLIELTEGIAEIDDESFAN